MPGPVSARLRDAGVDVWRAATWSAPVAFQVVFAELAGLMWLLARWPLGHDASLRTLFLTGVAISTVTALLAGAALLSAGSPRLRGIGLAVAGSGVAVLAAVVSYALWILPVMEPGA